IIVTFFEMDNIPIISSSKSILSKVWNQSDVFDFFFITIDKYTNIIRNDYKIDRLFSKILIISNSNSIYYLHSMSDFLYQNNPSDDVRLCILDVKISMHDRQE